MINLLGIKIPAAIQKLTASRSNSFITHNQMLGNMSGKRYNQLLQTNNGITAIF